MREVGYYSGSFNRIRKERGNEVAGHKDNESGLVQSCSVGFVVSLLPVSESPLCPSPSVCLFVCR